MLKERLKEQRNKKKLTQRKLAEIIGVSQQTIGSWETGRTEPDQLFLNRLADFFHVSIDYLTGRTDTHSIVNEISPPASPMMKILREAKGLTQQQLADKIGVNLNEYIAYENRTLKPSKEILNRLADELNSLPTLIWGTIDTDDEDYQKSMMLRQKYSDDKILEEFAPILNRDSIMKLLRQVGHYPDSEIFRIMNIITALELEKPIPGAVIEEVDLEE